MLKKVTPLLMAALISTALPAHAVRIVDNENTKAVGHVRWHKESHRTNPRNDAQTTPSDKAQVFFLRRQDNDGIQTSANIAINDRFQVSLQPGNYSNVLTCVGRNRIGAEITGRKTNDLLINAVDYRLDGGQNYYFFVDVDDNTGAASVTQVAEEGALNQIEKMPRQHHQISRVVPECGPEPAEPISIELEVLFDTDKSIVKPQYFEEIRQVADYMTRFPDTHVSLEGHTDSRASHEYNEGLAQRRVQAIRNVLVNRFGIDASRITTFGYGERRPRADNSTVEGRRLNRRVMAVFDTPIRNQ